MDNLEEGALTINTDGSMLSNPRLGGIGVQFAWIGDDGYPRTHDDEYPGYEGATINEMELQACIQALETLLSKHPPANLPGHLLEYERITICTDSRYVADNFVNAKFIWPRTKWLKSGGAPVANAQLWKRLVRCDMQLRKAGKYLTIRWVQGKTNQFNRAADRMAKISARKRTGRRISQKNIRRKKSPQAFRSGSVRLSNQILKIRIQRSEYMSVQKLNRYRYEVMSLNSDDYLAVDEAFSRVDLVMRVGRTYWVRFNDNQGNPRILRRFKEAIPL